MVYVADLLKVKFPDLVIALKKAMPEIQVVLLKNTKDIWCRDYMPIQSKGEMVRFQYNPPYLKNEKHLITNSLDVLPGKKSSDLIIDGGNIVMTGSALICTDAIYDWNSKISKTVVVNKLKKLLEVKDVIVIPSYPGDIFRHADGVIKLLNETNAFVLDDRKYDIGYTSKLIRILNDSGINTIPVPYVDFEIEYNDSFTARGNYINVLETETHILVPAYGLKEDSEVVKLYEKYYPTKEVLSIKCNEIADEGGVLNCVTWN